MSSEYNNQPLATSSDTPTTSAAQPTRTSQRLANNNNSAVFGFKSATHTPTTSVANYQPYPGLVSRANLDIMGDLDAMAKSWATEEWDHHRRLVQFWREQHGNKITATFQPIPQDERASNSGNIVVSCIYWMERNDFFITSVDCIYLLESLMDIRFSVEEKNRIRRNLEGFRPLTVSKCKAESADFFKIIMGFPNPKPRNIEKDVKVFPWKTLPYALKKIVTKYTASSYNNVGNHSQKIQQQSESMPSSSAAPMLPTPVTENPSSSVVTSANDTPFYQQQQQQPQQQQQASNSDRSLVASSYNAQPYSQEMCEPAYYNQQSNSDLNDPSTSTSTSNVTSATAEITPNADSNTITTAAPTSTPNATSNTSTSSPHDNENETSLMKPENCTSD